MAEALNILFLPKWYPNSYELYDGNFIENYAHAIKRIANITVIFVHSENSTGDKYRLEVIDNQGIKEIRIFFRKSNAAFAPLAKIVNAIRYRKAQKLAYQKVSNEKFDLAHVHVLSRSGYLAHRLFKKQGLPFVISEHWSGYHPEVGAYRGALKKYFTQMLVRSSASIHVVSSKLKNSMIRHQLEGDYTIIPNVVDEQLFSPKTSSKSGKKLLFVGNLIQEVKQIFDIIEVVAAICKKDPEVTLSIYGEGKDELNCQKQIEKLNMQNHIQLMGTRERKEIASIMADHDILILFSAYENQPCVINEALCCGIPVVAPDIEGIVEFTNNKVAKLYPCNNKEAFQSALEEMITNYADFNSQNIREFGLQNFGEMVIAESFLSFYQKALNK